MQNRKMKNLRKFFKQINLNTCHTFDASGKKKETEWIVMVNTFSEGVFIVFNAKHTQMTY